MSDNESWRSGFSSEFTDFTNNSESQTYEGLGSQPSNPNVYAQMMAQIMRQNEEMSRLKDSEINKLRESIRNLQCNISSLKSEKVELESSLKSKDKTIQQRNAEVLKLENLLAIEKKKVNLTPTQGAICRHNELSGSGFNLYKNYKISVDLKLHRNTDNGPDGSYCRAVLVFKVKDQNQTWNKMLFKL